MKAPKLVLIAVASLVALVGIEQLSGLNCYYSRLNSTTGTSTTLAARQGDIVSTDRIDRPIARWIPLVKYGETAYRHSHWQANGTQFATTTRTRLLVIGLCATAKYDALADKPFTESVQRYARR